MRLLRKLLPLSRRCRPAMDPPALGPISAPSTLASSSSPAPRSAPDGSDASDAARCEGPHGLFGRRQALRGARASSCRAADARRLSDNRTLNPLR